MDTEATAHVDDPTAPWECCDITPADVLAVLETRATSAEWIEYWCEGLAVARLSPSGIQIACGNPVHGTHKRYAEIAVLMEVARKRAGIPPSTCQECSGGWLASDSPQAARQLLLARFAFLFRGIILPPR